MKVNCPYCIKEFVFESEDSESLDSLMTFPIHSDNEHIEDRISVCVFSEKSFMVAAESGECGLCKQEDLQKLIFKLASGSTMVLLEGHSTNGGNKKIPGRFWAQPWENQRAAQSVADLV